MTGTGTQADPYIVSTWDEFLSVCNSTTQTYIKWADAENKEINFNDIAPDGFTSTVTIRANVDFNGWTLLNYRFRDVPAFTLSGDTLGDRNQRAAVYIENLCFKSFKWESSGYGARFIVTEGAGSYYSKRYVLKNCVFAGNAQLIRTNGGDYHRPFVTGGYTDLELRGCAFIIEGRADTTFFIGYSNSSQSIYIYDSNIKFDDFIAPYFFIIGQYGLLQNSRILGTFQSTSTSTCVISNDSRSNANLIDLECSTPLSYTGGLSVYNSDKASGTGSSFIACTDDQIHDAAYLRSIGFPIGVD